MAEAIINYIDQYVSGSRRNPGVTKSEKMVRMSFDMSYADIFAIVREVRVFRLMKTQNNDE